METSTLKDLRKRSGLSIRQVVERMRAVEPTAPQFRPGLIHLEKRGTDRLTLIAALASAYELPFDVVAQAAKTSREIARAELTNR